MQTILLTAAFLILPLADCVRESCDLIELNHFYDEHGHLVFDQLIAWDWHADERQFHVRGWRLIKRPSQIPQRDYRHGGYAVNWQDDDVLRCVRSKNFRETWLQHDPELIDREYLPKEMRRELRKP